MCAYRKTHVHTCRVTRSKSGKQSPNANQAKITRGKVSKSSHKPKPNLRPNQNFTFDWATPCGFGFDLTQVATLTTV